ncbi:bifunctional folylpolyglutamate synthase/dihydrofolate synthase, partial [Turicibacter sanguinis]|nr:bifunctional folylpolyglutamate synthase/dihydrofolate synthase [Turicibacter sanguinis]
NQFESYSGLNADYDEDYEQLLEKLLDHLTDEKCLIITGSLYFISEVRKYLMK